VFETNDLDLTVYRLSQIGVHGIVRVDYFDVHCDWELFDPMSEYDKFVSGFQNE
jgi:hypothetical protein